MSALDKIAGVTGKKFTPSGAMTNIVLETPEFRRVRDLPRRDWAASIVEQDAVEFLTKTFRKAKGTQTLKPAQAAGLIETADQLGLFAPIRVGGGKTLLSLLISAMIAEAHDGSGLADRCLLLTPASLVKKTQAEAYEYAKHWKIRPFSLESYEMLSRDKNGRIMTGLRPTIIIADEAHKLKSTTSACWKRLQRYVDQTRKEGKAAGLPWPHGLVFVAMSGTITTRSLREYWHIIRRCLGDQAMPMPSDWEEFNQWAQALDERVNPESRWQPDVFLRISPGFDKPAQNLSRLEQAEQLLVRARQSYQDRLVSTPGVISTKEDIPPMSLNIKATALEAPPVIRDAIAEMRRTYKTPDDHPFEMPMELWRHCRELQCGFYYVWDPRPPIEWIEARTEWSQFLRDTLKGSKYAAPMDIIEAIKLGELDDAGVRQRWIDIKNTFIPNTVPRWVDDTTLKYAADWLNTGDRDSKLCWVEHRAFGPKLSEMTGIPYFGQEALDSTGRSIDAHRGPAIVSVRSCSTGRNLQAWNANLYVSPMSKNDWWEQSMGRTHRDGQQADEVTVEILMMCREAYSSMVYAIREAEYTTQTLGMPQKLTYATRDLGNVEALIARRTDDLWKSELDGV